MASTPEEVIQKKDAFLKLPSVERVEEVVTKFPADIPEKQAWVTKIHQRLANLPREAASIPVAPQAELDQMLAGVQEMFSQLPDAAATVGGLRQLRATLRAMPAEEYQRRIAEYQQATAADLLSKLHALQAVSKVEPPQLADLPEGVLTRSVGKTGRYLMRVYSKMNIWDVGANTAFVHQVRSVDPEATGNPLQVYEASRQMKRSFEKAAWYALLAIIPALLIDFRRLGHALLTMLPMAVGLLQTVGLMGLLDIPLNPANMIVLPLVLGIGVDYGIHLVHDMRGQGQKYRGARNSVVMAVVVNALTTMVGFGALMVANHQGLQSLGRVLTIATGCCLFNSLVLPSLLRVGRFFAASEPSDVDDSDSTDAWDDERHGPSDEYADESAVRAA
jgi:predicted RND superfamily exporter protein